MLNTRVSSEFSIHLVVINMLRINFGKFILLQFNVIQDVVIINQQPSAATEATLVFVYLF